MIQSQQDLFRTIQQAQQYVDRGQYESARTVLKSVQATPAEIPELHYYRAMIAREVGEWSEACAILDELLVVEPGRAVIHLDRVHCLIELGEYERALEVLTNEDTPIRDLFPRHVFLAWVSARLDDSERAAAHLQNAIDCDPSARSMAEGIDDLRGIVNQL